MSGRDRFVSFSSLLFSPLRVTRARRQADSEGSGGDEYDDQYDEEYEDEE
jgi:hypothetical protein